MCTVCSSGVRTSLYYLHGAPSGSRDFAKAHALHLHQPLLRSAPTLLHMAKQCAVLVPPLAAARGDGVAGGVAALSTSICTTHAHGGQGSAVSVRC